MTYQPHNTVQLTITYSSVGTYTGDTIDGKMHGIGKMVFENNDVYEGSFANNNIYGIGIFIYAEKCEIRDGPEKFTGFWIGREPMYFINEGEADIVIYDPSEYAELNIENQII